jgi:hypothetical protein
MYTHRLAVVIYKILAAATGDVRFLASLPQMRMALVSICTHVYVFVNTCTFRFLELFLWHSAAIRVLTERVLTAGSGGALLHHYTIPVPHGMMPRCYALAVRCSA